MTRLLLIIFFCICGLSNNYAKEPGMILNSLEEARVLSKSSDMPILLIFGADWCGYCGRLKKDITDNKLKNIDRYIICYIDTDENKQLAKDFNVRSLPDSKIFKDDIEISKLKGYGRAEYDQWLLNSAK